MNADSDRLLDETAQHALPFHQAKDLAPLVERLARARIVMLGESTHGTHEFYQWRRLLTEWLVVKHGFRVIAVEGDWPPCSAVDRFINADRLPAGVRALASPPSSARVVLEAFSRWPSWMWANAETARWLEWLREHNKTAHLQTPVRFFGLDVYSLFESIETVIGLLDQVNPFLGRRARNRYACFDPYLKDERAYVRSLKRFPEGCEREVAEALRDILDARIGNENVLFEARQNATIVRNAERYYSALLHADEAAWNLREEHMSSTLDLLLRTFPESKVVVWAHNTHVGDYRATSSGSEGFMSLGGLARERYGPEEVALVGLGTYEGEVTASHAWDGPIELLRMPPARPGSIEETFHRYCESRQEPRFYLCFEPDRKLGPGMEWRQRRFHSGSHSSFVSRWRPLRAAGVVYDPRHERSGNYVPTLLGIRFDAFLFFDRTTAVEPILLGTDEQRIPETWPLGQ